MCDEENTSRLVIDINNKLHKTRHSNQDQESCFKIIMWVIFIGLRGLGVLQPITGALGAHFQAELQKPASALMLLSCLIETNCI